MACTTDKRLDLCGGVENRTVPAVLGTDPDLARDTDRGSIEADLVMEMGVDEVIEVEVEVEGDVDDDVIE